MKWDVLTDEEQNSLVTVMVMKWVYRGQFRPMENMGMAWRVAEKLKEMHWDSFELSRNGDEYQCEITCPCGPCTYHDNPHSNWHGFVATGRTGMEAICKVALMSVGCEVDFGE